MDLVIRARRLKNRKAGIAEVYARRGHDESRHLTSPLRDRFGLVHRLEFYSPQELTFIVTRSTGLLHIPIDEAGQAGIARRARGYTPHCQNRLIKRIRDYAEIKAQGRITKSVAQDALVAGGRCGRLDEMDRRILLTVIEKISWWAGRGRLVGGCGARGQGTLEDVYEPYLIQAGLSGTDRPRSSGDQVGLRSLQETERSTSVLRRR